MLLYEKWNDKISGYESQEAYDEFWKQYIPKEEEIYKNILGNKRKTIEGTIKSLANEFDQEALTIIGFLDGINTSLEEPLTLEPLTSESDISMAIDFEKLFYNMHDADADWLYNLDEWDDILSEDEKNEIAQQYNQSKIFTNDEKKVGRNDPCPCGSGKKYKKCCINK